MKFSYLKCVANLSLVAILKPFWRRLVKLFETVTSPSKRMERQTTPNLGSGPKLYHRSYVFLCRRLVHFFCLSCWKGLPTNENRGWSQVRPLHPSLARRHSTEALRWGPPARWYHCQLWLVHLKFERVLKFNSRSHSNSNRPVRVENETTLREAIVADLITCLWGKLMSWILKQIFHSSRVLRLLKQHMYLDWNILGFMELLVLLRFWTFPFEEKAICGVTPGQRWMELSAFKRRSNGFK